MFTRNDRVGVHKKQERTSIARGRPSVAELSEGVPIFRITDEGLMQYVRIGDTLYKNRYVTEDISLSASFGDDGYVKFDNGLILQWGQETVAASSEVVTFPIPFPTACLNTIATAYLEDDTQGTDYAAAIHTLATQTTVTFSTDYAGTTFDTIFWQAIGH